MATIGNVTIRIGANTRQLQYDLRRAESALKKSVANMQGLGERLSVGLSAPILGLGAVSLRTAGDIQALQKGLTAVMGSADAAALEFEKLREVAKLPGLGLEEAARGSVALQSAGFSADEARRSLLAFGNALATVGKGKNELNLVNLALTQLQNKTGGFGQDLRQLTEQLPQLRGALTAAFGTADSEKIQELGVTGREVVSRLTAELEKLPKVSGGINNAFENLGDSVKLALFTIGTSLNEAFGVESIFETLGNKIQEFADGFAALSPEVRKTIFVVAGLTAVLGPALIVFAQLYNAIQTVRIALISFVGLSKVYAFFQLATSGALGLGIALSKIGTAVVAFGAKLALIAPYTIVLAAIGAAAFAVYKNFNKVTSGQEELSKALQAVNKDIAEEKIKTDVLIKTIKSETATKREKANAIERLKQIAPGYFDDLNTENINVKALNESYVKYISNIKEAAKQKAIEGKLIELETKKLDLQEKLEKQQLQLNKANKEAFTPLATGSAFQKSAVEGTLKDIKAIDDALKVLTNNLSNPLSVKSESPTTTTTTSLLPDAPEIKTIEDEISALKKSIEQLGIAYAKTPTTGLLDKLNKQIDLLKSKESILENAEELVKRLSNPVTAEISLVPQIGSFEKAQKIISDFSLKAKNTLLKGLSEGLKIDTPKETFTSFLKSVTDELDKIDRQVGDGIISKLTGKQESVDKLLQILEKLRNDGFGDLSKPVIDVKAELDKLAKFKGFAELFEGLKKIGKTLEDVGKGVSIIGKSFFELTDSQLQNIDAREARELEALKTSGLNEEEKEKRKAAIEKRYDAERRKIQRKQAIANKALGIFNATISMFEGITKAIATFPGPVGLALAGVVGGLGAANIASIASAPIPALAIGTDYVKSDGMAMLHKGEAVVPADVVGGGFSRGMGGKIELYSVIRGNDLWLLNNQNMQREKRLK